MLNKIIQFSIKNKLIIGLLTLILIAWGVWSASKLPIDALPDITNNQVQIITTSPTLAAQEVEQFVTYPIERTMGNLPDIIEMRSFSRFGISVITIVFKDDVNIYFARQLVGEKLKEAEKVIPAHMGQPELAPVTTGLGEVYQYVLHPKKGSENKYSAMDLRTMQDWIISRQLYGIPGVAEVSGFGGITKQYEVSINPDRLKAMGVTIPEVFEALEKNNENTGGAYIDKKPNAYFIRGIGMVKNFSDIENIVVKSQSNGTPILIKDVAKIQFGSPPRYGAMTYNGEKEVVGGIVLMLKGANSSQVAASVKERMKSIQKSLPEDVLVEPFLDRTDLVKRAISTVEKNLIEGALIVLFVLILFLGNFRAGLVVASAIPLSMLFALGMMNLFGVSANLMSLGAIDFGLIVDGAVIIVEATLHLITHNLKNSRHTSLTQEQMDKQVGSAASRMMNSAIFGQIIIFIVYIPILSLIGIEGKMFRPMAETVSFAILGSMILSLTYIPMMSALFLSKKISHKENISDRLMNFFYRLYQPLLQKAINAKYTIVAVTGGLFIASIFIFKSLGGEFIPTLEEGDYAIEFVLPQGSSLSQTIETVMQAERIIKKFTEVKMVVGKTGAADIATDPMPIQASDLMVILKDKSEWKTTDDFYELAEMMKEKLENIPGVIAEPSQPIQMRFNELMTGIRQDVAIKIFGENLDTLGLYANKVARSIAKVEGITQPQVERISGLPQISIEYDRSRMALYGMNVEDVNHIITTAYAGEAAGVVFEDERKFDLVVRLDSAYRTSIDDINNLLIPTKEGNQIPLSQVANVSFKEGPAQISREDGKRRVYISFNVVGRDVKSVVEDIQSKLNSSVKLPSGYYFTYGGTFENLQKASARLMVAVPIALLLILLLLYFTFTSVKQAALIFTAIPMSAIGGVIALVVRGMPFSISAGIGFIALFGVAVLNGIVLVGTFNQLEKDGMKDVIARVIEGTKIRLRPVLMTATVASLGFFPMALSHSAGAEVQKPLATVVIGGLISATFLTLIVLPLLYIIFNSKMKRNKINSLVVSIIIFFLCANSFTARSQTVTRKTIDEVLAVGLKGNLQYGINTAQVQKAQYLQNGSREIPKTGIFVENEDFRPSDPMGVWKIGISQSFYLPKVNRTRKTYYQEQGKYYQLNTQVLNSEIKRNIREAYYQLWYLQDKVVLYQRLDSIYNKLVQTTTLKVKTGDVAGIERISSEVKHKEIVTNIEQLRGEMQVQQLLLMSLLNNTDTILPVLKKLDKLNVDIITDVSNHPVTLLQQQNISIANAEIAMQKTVKLPEFTGRAFSQYLYGIKDRYSGFSFTAAFPIFGNGAYKNKLKAAQTEKQLQELRLSYGTQLLTSQYKQQAAQVTKNMNALEFYETAALSQADEIIKAATQSYNVGEISYADYSQYLTQAIDIQKNYLDNLNDYNQSVIQLDYFINK